MASMNPDVAAAILASAKRLGVDPVHLGTVISYETGGKMDPNVWGGAGGRHMGLIQFGPEERKQYGAREGQSFSEQMGAVERYLTDRGLKPGMGLLDLYSTINAGRPGLYNRSDANNGGAPGTVRDKVEQQMFGHQSRAEELLGMRAPVGALMAPAAGPAVAAAPAGAPMDITAPAAAAGPTGITPDALAKLSGVMGGGKAEEFAPITPLQMPQVNNMGQSQQIAAAIARMYGIGV